MPASRKGETVKDPTEGWIPHTDETEALTPDTPIEIELDPLTRRVVFAALDAVDGDHDSLTFRTPETYELVEAPMRASASAISTASNITEQAVDETFLSDSYDDVPEKELRYSAISRFERCKADDGGCNGSAFYIKRGGSYYECPNDLCEAALVEPGKCEFCHEKVRSGKCISTKCGAKQTHRCGLCRSCDQPLRRVKVDRGTIVCLDPACGKISEYTGAGAESRGLASPPIQITSAAAESKISRGFEHAVGRVLESMLASPKWGSRTQIMLFILTSGQAECDARRVNISDPPEVWIREEAARYATAEGLKPPKGTEWTEPKVERGVGSVAHELRRRLRLDDTTAYREMADRFRRNGSQRLLDALADKLAADKRLRPLAKELGLTQ